MILTKNAEFPNEDLLELELSLRHFVLETIALTTETSPLMSQWIGTYLKLMKEKVECTPCEKQRLNLLKSVLFESAGDEILNILKTMRGLVETLNEIGVFENESNQGN